jgi:hypothetical protein
LAGGIHTLVQTLLPYCFLASLFQAMMTIDKVRGP